MLGVGVKWCEKEVSVSPQWQNGWHRKVGKLELFCVGTHTNLGLRFNLQLTNLGPIGENWLDSLAFW